MGAAWKTLKVVVTLIVLLVVASLIAVVVVVVRDVQKNERGAARAASGFDDVTFGMTVAQVEELIGAPSYTRTEELDGGSKGPCWYYGDKLSQSGAFAVCFRHAKVWEKYKL